ncbi:MAG: hypothetical protein JXA71_16035, partial [Chitinispirillaceae bacterium]|nr:hypothetical protein [Chitinispirillaceae bacterium]
IKAPPQATKEMAAALAACPKTPFSLRSAAFFCSVLTPQIPIGYFPLSIIISNSHKPFIMNRLGCIQHRFLQGDM